MKSGWVGVLTLGLSFWCGVARAECTKDIECKGDRICREGVCADAAPVTSSATSSRPAPEREAPEPQRYRRRSTGMMVTGIVLTSVAAAALVGGVAYGVASSSCMSELEEENPDHVVSASGLEKHNDCVTYGNRATVLLLVSVPFAGTGIPLWAVGAGRVPVARATLSPWLTPRAGGMSFVLAL